MALARLGKYEDAINAYETAIEINSSYSAAWNNKGIALSNLGRNEDALNALEKAIELNQNDPEAWYRKGVVLRELNFSAEAAMAFSVSRALESASIRKMEFSF